MIEPFTYIFGEARADCKNRRLVRNRKISTFGGKLCSKLHDFIFVINIFIQLFKILLISLCINLYICG